jgi:hypothetical protein
VWFGDQWNWIRERRAAVARNEYPELSCVLTEDDDSLFELPRPKPFVLWLFRQPTYSRVFVIVEPRRWQVIDVDQVQELRRIMTLFPEANVLLHPKAMLTVRPLPNLPTPPPPVQDVENDPFNPAE